MRHKTTAYRVAFLTAALLIPVSLFAQNVQTKIAIESGTNGKFVHDAPCFMVYPEGKGYLALSESGIKDRIEKALTSKGFQIVAKPDDAAVFIKVDFAQLEPFEAEVTFKGRDRWDYSNSSSTRNYAATMFGGRYAELGNPERNRATNNVSAMLGPSGEVIDPSQQKSYEAEAVEGEAHQTTTLIYPTVFQISGWRFDEGDETMTPQSLWKVTSSIENIHDEELQPLLDDLSNAAIKYIGKPLKKAKLIIRKTKSSDAAK